MIIQKEFRFEASHQIANHPGKCARLHGHSWVLRVQLEGKMDPTTKMVKDFYDVSTVMLPIIEQLDHHHLGYGQVFSPHGGLFTLLSDVDGMPEWFLPTSENLLWWIADQLPPDFPWSTIELNETCTSAALLHRGEWLYARAKGVIQERKETANVSQEAEGHEEGRKTRKALRKTQEAPAEEVR